MWDSFLMMWRRAILDIETSMAMAIIPREKLGLTGLKTK